MKGRQLAVLWPLWAIATYIGLICLGTSSAPPIESDSGYYIAMARAARAPQVPAPYSYRVFHPLLVRWVSSGTHMSLDRSFHLVALIAALVLCLGIAAMLSRFEMAWMTPVLLITPLSVQLFRYYYLPDLVHAAFIVCFFLALANRRVFLGSIFLGFAAFTRESTILLALIAAIWFIASGSWRIAVAITAATVVGLIVARWSSPGSASNVHQLSGLIYIALKAPHNLSKNLLGFTLVPNTLRGQPGYTCSPSYLLRLPRAIGGITEIGICPWSPQNPAITLSLLVTAFGIGPLAAVLFLAGGSRSRDWSPSWLGIAAIYGAVCFMTAPLLGAAVSRLLMYAWPLFWLALPASLCRLSVGQRFGFALLYSSVSWLAVFLSPDAPLWVFGCVVASAVALNLLWCFVIRSYAFDSSPA